jgi:phosphohistidine phosphatase SixA
MRGLAHPAAAARGRLSHHPGMDTPPARITPLPNAVPDLPPDLSRRTLLIRATAAPLATLLPLGATVPARAAPEADLVAALRSGGGAVLIRHARTVSGVGDPPGFDVAVCSTQRNLSDAGREQSRRIGEWFRSRSLAIGAVRSSRWCRCLDTATLAFPAARTEPWDALNSTFAERASLAEAQTAQLQRALAALRGRAGFEVWVTHMVNIQAFAGVSVAMGEAVLVRAGDAAGAPPRVVAQWQPGG